MVLTVILGAILTAVILLYFLQHRMIYYPQHYRFDLNILQPRDAQVVRYETRCGRQAAFYVAPREGGPVPGVLWVVFNGNAALALDLLDVVEKAPDPRAGFLMLDYPGYGECQGAPTPRSILESSENALEALAGHLKTDKEKLLARLRIFGYSLGTAAGLQLAARHDVERMVLVAPFTTMQAMARRTVGWPLCMMLRHRFDNAARLAELSRRPQRPGVVLLHGGDDTLVPVAMGRELAKTWAEWIEYHEIPGADHNTVIDMADKEIARALGT